MASNANSMDVDASVVKVNLENLKLWKSIFRSIKSVVDGGTISLCIHIALQRSHTHECPRDNRNQICG